MTTKRDSKSKQAKDERPKLKKEKLKDLELQDPESVKGGAAGRIPTKWGSVQYCCGS